jgi:hypothetical protein
MNELDISKKSLPDNTTIQTSKGKAQITDNHQVLTLNPKSENRTYWEAYHHDLIKQVIGPLEVNFNYYPNWAGYQRALILSPDRFRELLKKQNANQN